MSETTVTMGTKRCVVCNKFGTVTVPETGMINYMVTEMHIQEAMPTVPADIREQIISGTHPECWNILFPPEEDEKD